MATTFEKTWAFDLNRAYAPASALDLTRYTLWLLAAQLTGNIGGLTQGLWTLYASSDSVTAGTDATDRWVLAGPYNGAKIVRGATTAIHSWIVLRSPSINGNVWYMILSFNTAGDDKIRLSFTKTAPTSGSITVSPTAADQWANNTATATPGDFTINAAATDSSRFNLVLASSGCFVLVGCKQATGVSNLAISFQGLSSTRAGDLFPVFTLGQYNALGVLRDAIIQLTNTATQNARGQGGTVGGANAIVTPFVNSAQWAPTVVSPVDGTYADLPAWVLFTPTVTNAAVGGIRGRLADMAYSPNTPATLPEGSTVSPSSGSVDSVKVGNLWVPANAALNFS